MCGGRGQSDFSKCLWSSALISEFDSPPPPLCPVHLLPVFVTFLETRDIGEGGERVVVSLNQNQGHLYTYFLFLGWGERRGADLNLAFDFLLPIPFSQFEKKKKSWAAHLGSEGVGTFGSVECAEEVSRLLRRVEGVGIPEKGTLLVFVVAFLFFFFNLTSSSQLPEGGAQRREGCRVLERRLSCGLEHLLLF